MFNPRFISLKESLEYYRGNAGILSFRRALHRGYSRGPNIIDQNIHQNSGRRRELVNMLKNFRGRCTYVCAINSRLHDRELEEAAVISKIKHYVANSLQ